MQQMILCKPGSGSEPQCKMPSGGMSHRHHTIQVNVMWNRDRAQMVRSFCNVLKGAGPRAAGIPDPAIFQTPGRDPCGSQRLAKMSDVEQIVRGSPEPAMDDDSGRMRAIAGR